MPHPRRPTPALLVLCLALALGAGTAHTAVPAVDAPVAAAEGDAAPDAPAVEAEATSADAAAAPAECIEPVRRSGGIPRYPIDAARNGVQGAVRVHAEISAEGVVTLAEAIDGPRLLRTASADFIRASTYSPKTCGGVPVATTIEALVEFNLSWLSR